MAYVLTHEMGIGQDALYHIISFIFITLLVLVCSEMINHGLFSLPFKQLLSVKKLDRSTIIRPTYLSDLLFGQLNKIITAPTIAYIQLADNLLSKIELF